MDEVRAAEAEHERSVDPCCSALPGFCPAVYRAEFAAAVASLGPDPLREDRGGTLDALLLAACAKDLRATQISNAHDRVVTVLCLFFGRYSGVLAKQVACVLGRLP